MCSMMFRGIRECIILERVNTALRNLENHKVLLKDPVRPNEGPWLVMDPVGGSSCVTSTLSVRCILITGTVSVKNIFLLGKHFTKDCFRPKV